MFKKVLLFFFFSFTYFTSFSQKEGNVWCFAEKAIIDFKFGDPIELSATAMNTHEGCASISDENGDLQFYTDGTDVWDRTHQKMPNGFGLRGHTSSTQSAIITPVIGKRNQKYIFTVCGATCGPPGVYSLYYSIVDLNLPGNGTFSSPLGDLLPSAKNIKLVDSTVEKITAIPHTNQTSYWIVLPINFQKTFYAYHVTEKGISNTPVISSFASSNSGAAGYMKASKDGKMIVLSNDMVDIVAYTFNPCSGEVSNRTIIEGPDLNLRYGVEFSPNDSLFYVTSQGRIKQYQRYAPNIASTGTTVANVSGPGGYAQMCLQLANDGKIYFPTNPFNLGRIENPNKLMNPTITPFYLSLINGKISDHIGLPTFFHFYKLYELNTKKTICYADSAIIGPDTSLINYQYLWSPTTGLSNPTISNPTAKPFVDTQYTLTMVGTCNDTTVTIYNIKVIGSQGFLGNDTAICSNQSLVLDAFFAESSYLWSPGGDTTSSINIISSDRYHVRVTDDSLGCVSIDSIDVAVHSMPSVTTNHSDTAVCNGMAVDLIAYTNPTNTDSVLWMPGGYSTKNITVLNNGRYVVTAIDSNNCSDSAIVNITLNDCVETFFIPNSFSPNGDGANDVFYIQASSNEILTTNFSLFIFNRWGEQVFYSQDPYLGWNGGYNNSTSNFCQEDIYVCILNFSDTNNIGHSRTRSLSLIR